MKTGFLVTCAIFASLLQINPEAKIVRGYLRTGENWAYLSRFCFLSIHGKFKYEVMTLIETNYDKHLTFSFYRSHMKRDLECRILTCTTTPLINGTKFTEGEVISNHAGKRNPYFR